MARCDIAGRMRCQQRHTGLSPSMASPSTSVPICHLCTNMSLFWSSCCCVGKPGSFLLAPDSTQGHIYTTSQAGVAVHTLRLQLDLSCSGWITACLGQHLKGNVCAVRSGLGLGSHVKSCSWGMLAQVQPAQIRLQKVRSGPGSEWGNYRDAVCSELTHIK